MRKLKIKSKLIIMGIFILSILTIFIIRVLIKYNDINKGKLILREGQMISTEEVEHLLSFLDVQGPEASNDYKLLTFKDLSSLVNSTGESLELDINKVLEEASFDINEEDQRKAVLVTEFLEIYQGVLKALEADRLPIREEKFFIVGIGEQYKEDKSKEVLTTDQGNYNFTNALDYAQFHSNGEIIKEKNLEARSKDKEEFKPNSHRFHINNFVNQKVTALLYGDRIIYVKEILDEETVLYNAWITQGTGQKVKSFIHGVTKEFQTKYSLSEEINEVVGDIIVQNQEIIGIRIKPDRIDGKVLVTNKEYIEVDKYGQIPLDENYKIYKIYGELAQELTNSILVGYETTDFIVADGKIVAALIKGPIKAKNIRVLLKTDAFEDYYHKSVTFTSNKDFAVTSMDETNSYPANTEVTYKLGDEALSKGRLTVKALEENGKITISSIKRSSGNPSCRGSIEIVAREEGILIVNELALEEYLYAVVPSEMPSYYNMEALKSQAVCARSYAYNHLLGNSLKEYGAHVDDSVSFQVYNNIGENEETILAVKDTYGRVMKYGDSIIDSYYFSTSCGHTASVGEVWSGDMEYLKGRFQQVQVGDEVAATTDNVNLDFSNEETFRSFILKPEHKTYDSEFAWYRWKVEISLKELSKTINSKIRARYEANPKYIQTLVKTENKKDIYEERPIDTIGSLKGISVLKRGKSGIITELKLTGTDKAVKVLGQTNIRNLLSSAKEKIVLQDKSEVSQSILPSAFFVVDKLDDKILINGGGYGHGVGMSQNGAKAMADLGRGYDEILKHYYSGVEIGYIYD